MTQRLLAWSVTDRGTVRKVNEDALVDRPELGLWAVADGAGGHHAGDVASGLIVQALQTIPAALEADELLTQVRLRLAATHLALRQRAAAAGHAVIASTVVVLMVRGGHFACLWAGDSRAYLLRDGVLSQVTRDHSLVQELVDAGQLDPAEAEGHVHANVITRAVGAEAESLALDKATGPVLPGDRFLLCSDGLSKVMDDGSLQALLTAASPADALVRGALERGTRDNVTAVVVSCEAPSANDR